MRAEHRLLCLAARTRIDGEDARRAGHGVAIEAETDAATVLLVDADGPVAIAEKREGGLLKPTVGFRAS